MRAGRLDRRVDLQRYTATQDAAGQEIKAWATFAARRAAGYRPLRGEERFTASQFVAREQVEFTLRWSDDVSDLNPQDRIIFPAQSASVSPTPAPSAETIYEVMAVHEIGRRAGVKVLAARRAEQ